MENIDFNSFLSISDRKRTGTCNLAIAKTICYIIKSLGNMVYGVGRGDKEKIMLEFVFCGPSEEFFNNRIPETDEERIQMQCVDELVCNADIFHPDLRVKDEITLIENVSRGEYSTSRVKPGKIMVTHSSQLNLEFMMGFSHLFLLEEAPKYEAIFGWLWSVALNRAFCGNNPMPLNEEDPIDSIMINEYSPNEIKLPMIHVKTEACLQYMNKEFPNFVSIYNNCL